MKRLLILITVLIATACEFVVDIDVPNTGQQLAIGCLTESDSLWRVDVTKAIGILDNANTGSAEAITNAVVTITDQTAGTSVVLTHRRNGRYRSDERPIGGHRYSIRVEADGYPDVTATTIAPDVIEIANAEIDTTRTIFFEQYDYFPAKFTIKDPPGVKNTYELQLFVRDSSWFDFDPNKEPYWRVSTGFSLFEVNDPSLPDKEDLLRNTPYPRRFTDESFEGEEKTVTILIPRRLLRNSIYAFGIRLYNQGYELAKFVDDRTLQYQLSGYPFTQPVPVYSNVDNRNGIFGVKTGSMVEWEMGPVRKPD